MNYHRTDYAPGELDPPTGYIPAYANPGAIHKTTTESGVQRACRYHAVTWRGDEDCWVCREESR